MNKLSSCVIVFAFICYCFSLVSAQFGNFGNSNQCSTPDNRRGFCVDLRQCRSLFQLLQKNPLTQNDRYYLQSSQCGYYNFSPWVCCPVETSSRPGSPGSRPEPAPISRPGPTPTQQPQIQAPIRTGGLSPSDLPPPGKCGSQLSNRIIGGEETKIDEFPWMALIQYNKPNGQKGFHCGGVLIHKNYVLTASHCVNGKDLTQLKWQLAAVRLGEWDTATDRDCEDDYCADPVLDIPVTELIPHESYVPASKTQENDIALLRLARSVAFSDFVRPICLPFAQNLRNQNYNGLPLEVAGWGKTETASNSNIKLKVTVDGVPIGQCNNVYRAHNVVLSNSQLCAGGVQGFDSCRGDSGGPLMGLDQTQRLNPYYYLAGVVSFGPSPCGMAGWPGVYTRIDHFLSWILDHMRN